jgi:hypothetical protein
MVGVRIMDYKVMVKGAGIRIKGIRGFRVSTVGANDNDQIHLI